eukprot:scaffold119957_cov35-Tisochrysis_lutea.AAC.1
MRSVRHSFGSLSRGRRLMATAVLGASCAHALEDDGAQGSNSSRICPKITTHCPPLPRRVWVCCTLLGSELVGLAHSRIRASTPARPASLMNGTWQLRLTTVALSLDSSSGVCSTFRGRLGRCVPGTPAAPQLHRCRTSVVSPADCATALDTQDSSDKVRTWCERCAGGNCYDIAAHMFHMMCNVTRSHCPACGLLLGCTQRRWTLSLSRPMQLAHWVFCKLICESPT